MTDVSGNPVQDVENQIAVLFANGRRMMHQAAKTVHPELNSSGLFLMRLLQKRGPLRPSVIAGHLEVDRSAVSRAIAPLDSLGLIERIADPMDKRSYTVALTEDGRVRLDRLSAESDSPLRSLLASWDPEDVATLARLLARLNGDAAAHGIGQ